MLSKDKNKNSDTYFRKVKGELLKVDNLVNFNNHSPQNLSVSKENGLPHKQDDLNCFDNSWSDNAADAVSKAFNNMDDFLILYKENTEK